MSRDERISAAVAAIQRLVFLMLALVAALALTGCAAKPVIQTQVIEKPVAVYCEVATPAECKAAYAVDRVSVNDDPLTINRALRAEIEERWACEIKLIAAVKGCNARAVKIR
jgi:hypothetical protein